MVPAFPTCPVSDEQRAVLSSSAAAAGNTALLGQFVAGGLDPNGGTHQGERFLVLAAQHGHRDCVVGLLKSRADPNQHDHQGFSPLIKAAFEGHEACVRALIEGGANVRGVVDPGGSTPLHWSAYNGAVACCRTLLHAGADPMLSDDDGTPLDTARRRGHVDCAALLEAVMGELSGVTPSPISLTFENRTSQALRLCFLKPNDSQEMLEGQALPPHSTLTGVTYGGHEWRLRDAVDARLLLSYVVPASPASQTVSHPHTSFEFEDGPVGSGRWVAYDGEASSALLAAKAAGQPRLTLQRGGATYDVDLAAMVQRNARTGFVRSLREAAPPPPQQPPPPPASSLLWPDLPPMTTTTLRSFPGSYEVPPPYWSTADGAATAGDAGDAGAAASATGAAAAAAAYHCSEALPAESPLTQEVLRLLAETTDLSSLRLAGVHLVQNAALFDLYQAQRKAMSRRLGDKMDERWLWHGTTKTTVPLILANGFLRDFNSRGSYGRGSYFAKSANYSLQPAYAKPDEATGELHLLLCRVLVGEVCEGTSSMERPKQKPTSDEFFESMVDKKERPKIYVLSAGSDNRAYPEFVLRFHKDSRPAAPV